MRVFNGLTDEYHPTRMLADVMTMRKHSDKPLYEITYAFFSDTRMLLLFGIPVYVWQQHEHAKAVAAHRLR